MNYTDIIGIAGLVCITVGVLVRRNTVRNGLFVVGGCCMAAYSALIGNVIFLLLQMVFVLAAVYDAVTSRTRK